MTAALALTLALSVAAPGSAAASRSGDRVEAAQEHFYNGRYVEAAELTRVLLEEHPTLEVYELRTSILHFQLRRALGEPADREKALKRCEPCTVFLRDFMTDYKAGQAAAREALQRDPNDPDTLFYLGKIDLNYVWLVLGTLGKKTGWNEYWEARHSLDAALASHPDHLRARVARAWIDYIVDTRMPWGTGWLLGGGSKKRALATMREAAAVEGDYYDSAEAIFGLWDMQHRERRHAEALVTARRILELFPANADVAKFVAEARASN